MVNKLKDLRVILGIVLVLSWIILGGFLYISKMQTQKKIAALTQELQTTKQTLEQLGNFTVAYKLRADVTTGKKVEETDVEAVNIPSTLATNLVTDLNTIKDKSYKVNLKAGTLITQDMLFDEKLTDDMRLLDVVTNHIPIGLQSGTYVDIRITFPNGEDFVALPHKKVKDINNGVLKLVVNEKDIHVYNSMLVDSILYPGTTIYAVEYVEGGSQSSATAYYPIAKNILAIAQKDPNLLSAIQADILQRRNMLDAGLVNYKFKSNDPNELSREIERGKEQILANIKDAQREFERRMEQMKAQQPQQ